MGWLNFFEQKTDIKHNFGRGINASIAKDEEKLFLASYEAFENASYLDAYELFFRSMLNYTDNECNNNIITQREEDKLTFTIYQGSAKLTGYVTDEELYAEVIIVNTSEAHVALKRYTLERNYQLTYAYYFRDNGHIKLKLFHNNHTMTPQKIFFPLREIALNADFDKEFMQLEFPHAKFTDVDHLEKLDTKELDTKYKFMQGWIEKTDTKIEKLPSNDNAGMQAFSYLYLLFKIDYLLAPNKDIYQNISKKIQEYFSDETSSVEAKNEELKRYVKELEQLSFEDFSQNFYKAKYTFNPTDKSSHEEITNFINESLVKVRWYKNNRYNEILPTIYRYIALYILYNYGLNPVMRSLLHLLIEIQHAEFFKALDYTPLYDAQQNEFAKRAIITRITNIIIPVQSKYKNLKVFGDELDFSSFNEFSNSFYMQIKHLDFEEV